MSRSNPVNTLTNPAVKFINWDSEKGQFKYYNKETKENVEMPLPIRFYVLDELATIKGFSDKHQGGIWSNEVKNITLQKLKVVGKDKSNKNFNVAEGFYQEIKDTILATGAKYTRSLYATMLNENDEYELVNFQLKGAAFSGWLDFVNMDKRVVMTNEIICDDFKKEKKGATKYTIPVFSSEPASEEGNEAAITLDVKLQDYLKEYFEKTQAEVEFVNDKDAEYGDLPSSFDDEDENSPFK